jgi:hypothetical protein
LNKRFPEKCTKEKHLAEHGCLYQSIPGQEYLPIWLSGNERQS